MAFSLQPRHLKRYRDIAGLLWKYGRSDVLVEAGLGDELDLDDLKGEEQPHHAAEAEQLAADLESLGPTFVKLGQVLSSRADLFPPVYLEALSRLQDKVEPFPFEDVEHIVQDELCTRLSKAFREFSSRPIAAASLGQVHHATLRDGTEVAVKVQRPDVRRVIMDDLEALEPIARVLNKRAGPGSHMDFETVLSEFRRAVLRELDYTHEVRNLKRLRENLQEFENIVVPQAIESYCSSRVLTMEFVRGRKVTKLNPVVLTEVDGESLADEVFHAYLKQILVDGFCHADPHAGNVLLTEDHKIALIDLGQVVMFSPRLQERLLRFVVAVSEGRSDEAADIAIDIGGTFEDFDEVRFRREVADLVAQQHDTTVEEMQIGQTIMKVARIAGANGVRVVPELTMLGKTLMNLDEVGRCLSPRFNPNESIRKHASGIMQQRLLKSVSPASMFSAALEMKEFTERLPARVSKILDMVGEDRLRVGIDVLDDHHIMQGLQKVANRVASGLIAAALIVGAAMLMQVPTTFRIFGYPGFAMICFLGAVGLAVALLIASWATDESRDKRTDDYT